MAWTRREFMQRSGMAALAVGVHLAAPPSAAGSRTVVPAPAAEPAEYTIRIGTGLVELAPGQILSTTTYNGQFPGPLLRFREGRRTVVDLYNDTDTPEQLHWHGQTVPADVDGAAEEGTPYIPAHGHRRISFIPGPAGFRFFHTHVRAGGDLHRGQYSGQVGLVYIEPQQEPGAYDREVFLTLKEFRPSFSHGGEAAQEVFDPGLQEKALKQTGDAAMRASLAKGMPRGYEVGYDAFAINGRKLGHGEPVRVRAGERVLFHILNASATEIRSLALPGHRFRVVAMDGNPVPTPTEVPLLWIGTAERISAVVEMNHPGVWILGDLDDDDRRNGMGIVVEYAGRSGPPQWVKPAPDHWDYTRFGRPGTAPAPDETIDLVFAKQNAAEHGFNRWTVNGEAFSMQNRRPLFRIHHGRRYRLRMRNASDDIHPMHLHRHIFELTKFAGRPTMGLRKDVVMLGGYQAMEVDFVADQPGLSLLHCHMQLHMDYGFMALLDCA